MTEENYGKPIEFSPEEKRKAFEQHIAGLLTSMNNKQRRAFVSKLTKTKSMELAVMEARKHGFHKPFILPRVPEKSK
jgi:hypothetical protein